MGQFLKEIKPHPRCYKVKAGNVIEWVPSQIDKRPSNGIITTRIVSGKRIIKGELYSLYDRAVKLKLLFRVMPKFYGLFNGNGWEGVLIEEDIKGRNISPEQFKRLLKKFYAAFAQLVKVDGDRIEFHLHPSTTLEDFKIKRSLWGTKLVLTKTPLAYLYTGETERERRKEKDLQILHNNVIKRLQ